MDPKTHIKLSFPLIMCLIKRETKDLGLMEAM